MTTTYVQKIPALLVMMVGYLLLAVVGKTIAAERDQALKSTRGEPMDTTPPVSSGPFAIQLKVVDPAGQPIPACEGRIYTYNEGYMLWRKSDEGTLRFLWVDLPRSEKTGPFEVLIRAKGFAPAILAFDQPKTEGVNQTVTLEPGKLVEMTVIPGGDSKVPSDLLPLVYFPNQTALVRMMRQPYNKHPDRFFDFDLTLIEIISPGHYRFRIPEDTPQFFVSIDSPGFLCSYDAGPFAAKDLADDTLRIQLPKPATLNVKFGPPKDFQGELPYQSCSIDVFRFDSPDDDRMHGVSREVSTATSHKFTLTDLPPGEYNVMVRTVPKQKESADSMAANPGAFRDSEHITLTIGDTKSVEFEFVPFNPEAFKGQEAATLNIVGDNGEPLSGKPFKITYSVLQYGQITVLEGTLPKDGRIELKNVDRGRHELEKPIGGRTYWPQYSLEVDGKWMASFDLVDVDAAGELELRHWPDVQDPAPDIEVSDLFTEESVRLSAYKGKPVFIEFWATGCGPCQPEMGKLAELLKKRGESWKGKAEVLAISIDKNPAPVREHVKKRGWESVRHNWCGDEKGFLSNTAKTYGIHGIPTAVLIDSEGKIVWRGHPNEANLESRLDRLLAKKPSTAAGP